MSPGLRGGPIKRMFRFYRERKSECNVLILHKKKTDIRFVCRGVMSVGDFNVLQISCKIVSYEAQDLHSEKIIRKIIYEEFGKNFLLN